MSDCTHLFVTPYQQIQNSDYCSFFVIHRKGSVKLYAHFEKRCSDFIPLKVQWYKNNLKYKISEIQADQLDYFTTFIEVTENGVFEAAIVLNGESELSGCGQIEVK